VAQGLIRYSGIPISNEEKKHDVMYSVDAFCGVEASYEVLGDSLREGSTGRYRRKQSFKWCEISCMI